MDSVPVGRSGRRTRTSRQRRTFSPMQPEALEQRTLLALSLLKDINPVPLFPAQITGAGENVYFVTTAKDGGSDLDVKTATGVTVLKESQQVSDLTAVGSKLFFSAYPGQGQQLWVTNGTRAGTRLVKDLSSVGDLTAAGSELFFTSTVSHGKKAKSLLYKSNGTAAGTVPVAMPPGAARSRDSAGAPVSFAGAIYFAFGNQLMKTNGARTTVVGTFAPPNSNPDSTKSVDDLTVAGGVLYFSFPDASQQGLDLYASNGTAGGTALLKDFVNASLYQYGGRYLLSNFTAVGSKLYFGADPAADGPSLWVSDGTSSGTKLVKPLGASPAPLPDGAAPSGQPIVTSTGAGTRLFFTTDSSGPGTPGTELWVSDGTAAGTTMLADIDQASTGSYPPYPLGQFAALNGALYFANDDAAHGVELWRSDGTAAGTSLFLDINPGPAGSFPANMAVINNALYFSATTTADSSALWSSNGTAAGTSAVASFNSQPQGSAIFNNFPVAFAVIGNTMVFPADDGTGTELWKTDGTPAGTTMIKVLAPGLFASPPSDFTTVGNQAFFVTGSALETLWVSDGTTAGTTEVATFDGTIADPVAFDGKLAFIESTPDGTGTSLWVSDGTASGTTQVTSFPSQSLDYGAETPAMAVYDGRLYISAPVPSSANTPGMFTIWDSDGTTAGTMPVAGAPSTLFVSYLAVEEGKLYFSVDTPRTQIWVTTGTAAGTKMVANVGPGSLSISDLLAAGPNLFIFTTNPSSFGPPITALFKSNGTAKGTELIHSFVNNFGITSGGLPDGDLVLDVDGTTSNSIWVSNGTATGTTAVKGLGSDGLNYIGDYFNAITPINGRVFLQGSDPKHGTELWQSNGTVAGTTLVQDIDPGKGSSYPYALTVLNGNLIVAADDGTHGTELLSGPVPGAPAAAKPGKPSR